MPGGTSRRWSELRELLFCNVFILKKAYLYFRKKPIFEAWPFLQFEPNLRRAPAKLPILPYLPGLLHGGGLKRAILGLSC